jgi:hypothetical protein
MSLLPLRPPARLLRVLAWSYAIKSLVVVLLWLLAPDLPAKALEGAKTAWDRLLTDIR